VYSGLCLKTGSAVAGEMDEIKERWMESKDDLAEYFSKAAGLDLFIFFLLTGKYHLVYKIKV
jgi:hypothetical protein